MKLSYSNIPKNKWATLALCFFFGMFGAHRFYEGKICTGILWLCTGGMGGVGWFIDFIIILTKPNPYFVQRKKSVEYTQQPIRVSINNNIATLSESRKLLQRTRIEVDLITDQVAMTIFEIGHVDISAIQRKLRIGFNVAIKAIENLENLSIISGYSETSPRELLVSRESYIQHRHLIDTPSYENLVVKNSLTDKNFSVYGDIDSELLTVDLMDGHAFEHWCADLLSKNGFTNVEVTPGSGDHGVDVIAEKEGVRYAIQCKCYSHDLGNTPVQEVYAGKEMYRCQVGIVMTNRYFTAGAKALAEQTRVLLWDRDKLQSLIAASE